MNLENLINNLEANNMPYYVQDGKYEGQILIGVPTQSGEVYYWFKFYVHDDVIVGDEYLHFVERYNRNTGTRLMSFKTENRFRDDLVERNVSKHKKRGLFDYISRRSSNGLIGNGTNPLIN